MAFGPIGVRNTTTTTIFANKILCYWDLSYKITHSLELRTRFCRLGATRRMEASLKSDD